MTEPLIIRPGVSLPFEFDLDGDSIDGWTCTIKLKRYPDDTALVDRVITETEGDSWVGHLTATETALCSEGAPYRLTAVVVNSTTDEKDEIVKKYYVGTQWSG